MAEAKNSIKDIIIKAFFVIGIVVIVLILAYAIIQFIPRIFNSLGSLGSAIKWPSFQKAETLEIQVSNDSVPSRQAALLSWDYQPKSVGDYDLKYPCIEDLEIVVDTGEREQKVLCNTFYKMEFDTDVVEIVPIYKKSNSLVDVPIKIRFTEENGNVLAEETVELTVLNDETKEIGEDDVEITQELIREEENNPSPSWSSGSRENTQSASSNSLYRSNNNSEPDLVISNLNSINNQTATFKVTNQGNKATGNWFFRYSNQNGQPANSPLQNSIAPGDAILFTLNFGSNLGGAINVFVDPNNAIKESNEINNSQSISVGGQINSNYFNNATGGPDLVVSNFEVGRMSGSRFISDDDQDEGDDAAVKFTVRNIGSQSSGSWKFEISDLPYDNEEDYESRSQNSIAPGQSVDIIVEFENIDEGNYRLELEVDSDNDIREVNERNNEDTARLEVDN